MIRLKWVGIVSILAAVLEIVGWPLITDDYSSARFYVSSLFNLAGMVLLLFTLFGIYLAYRKSTGWYNLLCLIISVIGTGLFIGQQWMHAFVEPVIHRLAPEILKMDPGQPLNTGFNLSFFLFALGLILVGILILIGKVVPKYVGVILIIAPIADISGIVNIGLGQPISAIAVFLIGLSLLKQKVDLKE